MRIRKDDGLLTDWGCSYCVTKQQTATTPYTTAIS